jgi:Transcription termination factor nusG
MLTRTNGADPVVVACHDDWWVGYSLSNAQHIAQQALGREGFECWYPIRKVVSRRPASSLPSKTRHKRRFEMIERTEPVLGSYLFIRRLFGTFDLAELYKLPGVGSICRLGPGIASIKDWEVELLRLAESRGRFNVFHVSVPGAYRVAIEPDPRLADPSDRAAPYVGTTRWPRRSLDDSARTLVFVQDLDRIVRIIQECSPAQRAGTGIEGLTVPGKRF